MQLTTQYNQFARRPFGRGSRRGFTLLELIIVMGLIALLASLSIYALSAFQANARNAATETLINKLDSIVQQRMGAIDRYLTEADRRTSASGTPSYVATFRTQISNDMQYVVGGGTGATAPRLFGRKRSFIITFPQRFSEVPNPPSMTDPSKHTPETESSEMLYWFMTNSTEFDTTPLEAGDFNAREVADTDGDGLLEFVDAWGYPLRFYRWPTRLIRPKTSTSTVSEGSGDNVADYTQATINTSFAAIVLIGNPPPKNTLSTDQDDPIGLIANNLNRFERNFHTAYTWHAPLIMSVGEDGSNGLFEPSDTARFGHLAQPDPDNLGALEDNVSNLTLRAGGK